jgi:hypothetical protein
MDFCLDRSNSIVAKRFDFFKLNLTEILPNLNQKNPQYF